MKRFKNTDQFRAYIRKEASRLGIGVTNAYTTYLARDFLEKLSKYNTGAALVKGSSAETAYLGQLVRGITDVDVATLGPIEANIGLIKSVVDDQSTSDFRFQLAKPPVVTPTGIYKMSFEASFDRTRFLLNVDFQENYDRLIERETRTMPAIFEGERDFKVSVPSFEEYLAEKLCIILESNKPDMLNTRVKDFYDIYRLHGGKYDPEKLTQYFGRMLALRGKISLKDASTLHLNREFIDQHQDIWERAKDSYDFLDDGIDLGGAVYYARAVLREELQKNGSEMPSSYMVRRQPKKYYVKRKRLNKQEVSE